MGCLTNVLTVLTNLPHQSPWISAAKNEHLIMSHPFMNTRSLGVHVRIHSVSSISTHQTFCSRLQLYSKDEDSLWHIQTKPLDRRVGWKQAQMKYIDSMDLWCDPTKSSNCLPFFLLFSFKSWILSPTLWSAPFWPWRHYRDSQDERDLSPWSVGCRPQVHHEETTHKSVCMIRRMQVRRMVS